jgi:hypothetical protein
MAAATTITLVAGGMTFINEWYQTKSIDWKVPVATLILAAAMSGFDQVDHGAATAFAVIVFLGAATTEFNGKSPIDVVTSLVNSPSPAANKTSKISNR